MRRCWRGKVRRRRSHETACWRLCSAARSARSARACACSGCRAVWIPTAPPPRPPSQESSPTLLHLYDKLAKHAGAGTIVPITGFANAIVSPAIEYKSEGLILGLGAKLFVIAGPVLVYGITASVLYGLVLLVLKGGGAG